MSSDCATFPFAVLTVSSMPERATGANGGVWLGIESVSEVGTGGTSLMALPVSGIIKRGAGVGVGAAPERNGTANNAAAKKEEDAKRILATLPSRPRAGVAVTFDGWRRFLVATFRRSNGAGPAERIKQSGGRNVR